MSYPTDTNVPAGTSVASPFSLGLSARANNPITKWMMGTAEMVLGSVLGLTALNEGYAQLDRSMENDASFAARALKALDIDYRASIRSSVPVPATGPLIVIANHPFGGLEGMVLLDYLRRFRPNVRLLANYILNRVPEMRSHIISVDPFELEGSKKRNIAPLRQALQWLTDDGILGIFPSGTVSHLDMSTRTVKDPAWHISVARLIQKSGASVLPIYFHGRNSAFFQMAGLINPLCRTALLPRELLNKRGRTISFEVGQVISKERLGQCQSEEELLKYVRFCTQVLRYRAVRKTVSPTRLTIPDVVREPDSATVPVAGAVSREILTDEVSRIPASQRLASIHDFDVFYATGAQIPSLILELGRIREIAFRAAGEGTGRDRDIDRFDHTYLHLISWDKTKQCVVGAYRLGLTDRILASHGLQGLYTHSLFDYSEELLTQLGPSLELGRSFVSLEYQKSSLALFSLWRGIGAFVNLHPRYRRLFGLVSISSNYAPISRSVMVNFLRAHRSEPDWASLVKPRTTPKEDRFRHLDEESVQVVVKNIDDVTHLITDIEHEYRGMPVLMRQYLKLGGKFIGFSLDQSFGNVVDGLIVVDLLKTRRVNLERYLTPAGVSALYQYHQESYSSLATAETIIEPSLA